ncbi:MAG: polysaccharide deacetylase family protein [Candidatus Eremiobacteraeota bacterium]|nr:polysaccharide deacetylase family protein [Candidatus Eremiobacteraeota bacterium]
MKRIILVLLLIAATAIPAFSDDDLTPRLQILCYHQIAPVAKDIMTTTPEMFEAQVRYLRTHDYYPVGMEEAVAFLKGRKPTRQKMVMITFDDGYDGIYHYGLPILRKYRFPAVVFLVVSKITENGERSETGHLSWKQLRVLRDSGLFYIGSHTNALHQKVQWDLRDGRITSSQLIRDLCKSRIYIYNHLGILTDYLAWPYGGYDDRTIEIARNCGFKVLFTTDEGSNHRGEGTIRIRRIALSSAYDDLMRLEDKLTMFP